MPWDPDRYHQFTADRAAPFHDLVELIQIRPGMRVVDLGCGTGELTARLADLLPQSDVVGIDTSAEMLGRADGHARPGLRFEQGSIEGLLGTWDLIFSHAALHWVENHHTLVPSLISHLAPGGQLAVQVPSNFRSPAQTLVVDVAGEEPFREVLCGWTRVSPVLSIDEYATLLWGAGGAGITAYEKVYPAVLENSDAVAEWTAGTVLVPYFERLPPALHDRFMDRYREKLRTVWPDEPAFYPFRRTLFAATRSR